MGRKKGSLSHRKNEQSPYHRKRAEARRQPSLNVQEQSFEMQSHEEPEPPAPESFKGFAVQPLRKGIRVLSLFDGIGTALYVLDSMNLHVEAYFSSEVDPKALKLQKYRFGDRISRLGCVTTVTDSVLDSLGSIDLLIGGSPCSELSLVNWRRKGLHDPTSTGILFYEYVRIRDYLGDKASSAGNRFYYLFENTAHMEISTREEMSRTLGCAPIIADASAHVPADRKRYFWSNLMLLPRTESPSCCAEQLSDILKGPSRIANVEKVHTLTTSSASQKSGKTKRLPVSEDGKDGPLFITEWEALLGFKESFTDGPNLSITDRIKLLGKAFCVPVVLELLAPLREIFWVKDSLPSLELP